jgi:hypothetical protein
VFEELPIRARKAIDRALRDCQAMRSNSARCALFTTNACFFGRLRRGSIPQPRMPLPYICNLFMNQEIVGTSKSLRH